MNRGKVKYEYNIHGQTTEITGPGLTQRLYYTDGPWKGLYNGSVSAITWTMDTDTRVRGYRYTYNGYGWLTAAEYGEHDDLKTNTNRYTERCLDFMRNGGIRRLQRHGLKADGVYGKVDNLHIYYEGNRITKVLEDADPVTQNGSMDYAGGNTEMAFEYNEWGALTKDESRGITSIEYDNFGNPVQTLFSNGCSISNVYSSNGERLRTVTSTGVTTQSDPVTSFTSALDPLVADETAAVADTGVSGQSTVEYRGPVIYRYGKVDMVLFSGGYATIKGTEVTFHYYTPDYLGNNRAVINGSTGVIEQTVAYYP